MRAPYEEIPDAVRAVSHASTSDSFQTVTPAEILCGAGNLPSRTQRHTVAGLTGNLPGLAEVVARPLIRITLWDILAFSRRQEKYEMSARVIPRHDVSRL